MFVFKNMCLQAGARSEVPWAA